MALEIEGRIIRRLGIQRGISARGNWAKQEFIVEFQDGNYPSQVCLNVWGEDKVKDLERFHDGDSVRISFRVSSREFGGKWYTDLRAWRIEPAGAASNYGQGPDHNAGRGANRAAAPSSQAPAPSANDLPDFGDDDDLPF